MLTRDLSLVFGLHADVHNAVMYVGYAFVNTTSIEGATKAMNALQGTRLHGQELKISFGKDR